MHPDAIGPFKIERELGRGGMGEVFLAHDTRLDRHVAIKALPAHLAQDDDRLARFQREAKVLASLNHPAVGAIYGLEEAEGRQYLILEFVDGETLAERLAKGAIAIDEALMFARQIAEALEAAHDKGIIHRDLKPGNVMVTPEGTVKVLDFGLARTADGSPSTSNAPALADSPTMTSPARHSPTIPGVIMGTAGYMSPEQARGKPVDKRSDIFSFGCVLYEMFTGGGPFPGETVTDSLGAILHREPNWALLPPTTPPRIRDLLIHCLAKDRKNRLHDIGDARLEIERALSGHEWAAVAAPVSAPSSPWRLPSAIAAGAALLAAGWGLARLSAHPAPVTPRQTFHVSTMIPDKPAFDGLVGISPDATFLVYTAAPELPAESTKPEGLLMVRRLDRDETTILDGTEGATNAAMSPDGRSIAFACAVDRARTKFSLKKVALENGRLSGRPELVCELSQGGWFAICWSTNHEIIFSAPWVSKVFAVSASGGEPRMILQEDGQKGIENWSAFRPLVLGQTILATRWSLVGQKAKLSTEVIELATGKHTPLLADAGAAQYVEDSAWASQGSASKKGYLLAARSSLTSLIAMPFDLASQRPLGEPVTVWSGNALFAFDLSPSGSLALAARTTDVSDRRLAWIDDKGQPQPIPGMMRAFNEITVSPDGGRVLATLDNGNVSGLVSELWIYDLARRTPLRHTVPGDVIGMIWSPDGQRIVHGLASDGGFSLWERRSDGSGEPVKLLASPDSRTLFAPTTWSPDGKWLAFVQANLAVDDADAYLLDYGSGQRAAKPYLKNPANEAVGRFSPDGKWVLIGSSQSGRDELYAQRFTGDAQADSAAGRVPISQGGASTGVMWWSADGKEIRYIDRDNQVLSVQVKLEPTFAASEPKVLYSIKDLKTKSLCFGPDGRLMAVLLGQSELTTKKVDLVVNFLDELRAKLAGPK